MNENWTPSSWRSKPGKHMPDDYPDLAAQAAVERTYAALGLPANVRAEEIPPDDFVRLTKAFYGDD